MQTIRFSPDVFNALFARDPFGPDPFGLSRSRPRAGAQEPVSARVWRPAVDVYEDQDNIVLRAELPGMKQEDMDIELTGDTLTVKGERKFEDEERRDNYVRVERAYGPFQRSFTIGVPIQHDNVRAAYREGVLEITLPKAEETKPKKVKVGVEG